MTEKERKMLDATFDMEISNEVATVKRTFTFEGAKIEFEIGIGMKGEGATSTVSQLHQGSVKEVIALLEQLIPGEK